MLLASVVLWRSEFPRLIMHCAKAFLLIKCMSYLLLCLMSLYPWTLRSARSTTLACFFLSISLSSFPFNLLRFFNRFCPEGGESFVPCGFLGPVEFEGCCQASPPDLQAAASSGEIPWAEAVCCALWSCSPELYSGRYNWALRHQHDYTVFFYLKNTGHQYCCSATWNCVSLLASLNFKNIFPRQLK